MTTETEASGFWSYVHRDNEQVGGRILRLAEMIGDEFALLTGTDLELFVDRESLSWGDQWRIRIESALQDTTFFIPIVTPRYFASTECRRELLKFATHARSLGADELLLPILFVTVPALVEDSPDEAKALIARTQYEDWTDLRLTDERAEDYASAVNRLAMRLAEIASTYGQRPSVVPSDAPSTSGDVSGDEVDDEPGIADYIAKLEEAQPEWTQSIEDMTSILGDIGEITTRATERVEREGDSFVKRVVLARQFAAELDAPAERLMRGGERYAGLLLEMDPGVRALITLSAEQVNAEDIEAACSMFESLRGLIQTSQDNELHMRDFTDSLRAPARQYRDLRPVIAKMETGMRSVLDAQTVMSEWTRLMDESPLECPPHEPGLPSLT